MKNIVYAQEKLRKIYKDEWFKDHYSPREILNYVSPYTLTMGGRNLGKTYAYIILIIAAWQLGDGKSCIMRRYDGSLNDIDNIFQKVFASGVIENKKEYTGIKFRKRAWCGYWEKGGKTIYDVPFCYTYAMGSAMEKKKGSLDIENLWIVLFDEALTNEGYLLDEWNKFQNAISTIVRENDTAMVVLCANTVSWSAPYFREFGIEKVRNMKEGDIKLFKAIGETSILVEYCDSKITNRKKKIVDRRFFGFKSGTSEMIKRGSWEMKSYQHLTRELIDGVKTKNIEMGIYLEYGDEICRLEVKYLENIGVIVNVVPAPDTDYEKAIRIYRYDDITDFRQHKIPDPKDPIDSFIWGLYKKNLFFYADNLCGETVSQYLKNSF